jgi:hypothetical protein
MPIRGPDRTPIDTAIFARIKPALRKPITFDNVYKFLFDLTGGGNWLVDVHASS